MTHVHFDRAWFRGVGFRCGRAASRAAPCKVAGAKRGRAIIAVQHSDTECEKVSYRHGWCGGRLAFQQSERCMSAARVWMGFCQQTTMIARCGKAWRHCWSAVPELCLSCARWNCHLCKASQLHRQLIVQEPITSPPSTLERPGRSCLSIAWHRLGFLPQVRNIAVVSLKKKLCWHSVVDCSRPMAAQMETARRQAASGQVDSCVEELRGGGEAEELVGRGARLSEKTQQADEIAEAGSYPDTAFGKSRCSVTIKQVVRSTSDDEHDAVHVRIFVLLSTHSVNKFYFRAYQSLL